MFLKSEFNIVANLSSLVGFLAGVLVLLMMSSMFMPVQASDAGITTEITTTEADAAVTSTSEDKQRTFSFPRWPQSRQINRERIPLAPPGPYMSSALNVYSFKDSSFDSPRGRYAGRTESSRTESTDVFMDKYSPDVPWPSQAKSPARWRPDDGYRFIEPPAVSKPYQATPSKSSSNNNNGYKRRPVMTWPGNESVRRNPVTK